MHLKYLIIGFFSIFLMNCGSSDAGPTSSFGNEIDYSGYAKLRSVKFILNPKLMSTNLDRYLILKKIIKADVQIDKTVFSLDSASVFDGTDLVVSDDSLVSISKPNYLIELSLLNKLDSVSIASEYREYLNGNIEVGEHVYIIRSVDAILVDNTTVNIRIDQVGTFTINSDERTKYLGQFTGEYND